MGVNVCYFILPVCFLERISLYFKNMLMSITRQSIISDVPNYELSHIVSRNEQKVVIACSPNTFYAGSSKSLFIAHKIILVRNAASVVRIMLSEACRKMSSI